MFLVVVTERAHKAAALPQSQGRFPRHREPEGQACSWGWHVLTETPQVCHWHFHVTLHPQESFELQPNLHADGDVPGSWGDSKEKPAVVVYIPPRNCRGFFFSFEISPGFLVRSLPDARHWEWCAVIPGCM